MSRKEGMVKMRKKNSHLDRYGGWLHHRYLELNARIRKGIQNPRRERLALRNALANLKLRYRELVPFFNPIHTGFRDNEDGTIQWLDACIYQNKMLVILFDVRYPGHGVKPHELRSFEAKKSYLQERAIPFLVLNRKYTSQEMEMRIRMFLRKEKP